MKGKLFKILGGILAIVVLGICIQILLLSSSDKKDAKTNNLTSLRSPFLALAAEPQLPGTTFLEEEAGISAYTNVGKTIDLSKARAGFKTIEKETDEYIIGSVRTTGAESDDAHCYVHKDGWIVTYYLKNDPIAKIIYWDNLQTTKLEKGISNLCAIAEVPLKEVKYYDFRYPGAQKLMITTAYDGSFKLKIPSSYNIYERSYSMNDDPRNYRVWINNNAVGFAKYGTITSAQLNPDVFHIIECKFNAGGFTGIRFGSVIIILAYSER